MYTEIERKEGYKGGRERMIFVGIPSRVILKCHNLCTEIQLIQVIVYVILTVQLKNKNKTST